MRKKSVVLLLIFFFIIISMIISALWYAFYYPRNVDDLGVKAVVLMYEFEKIEDLAGQDAELKGITTDTAYNYLTVTDSDRALNTYLKFKKKSCSVRIVRSNFSKSGGSVVYTLDSVSVSNGRTFSFIYDLVDGKIDNPREYECIDFKKSNTISTKDTGD